MWNPGKPGTGLYKPNAIKGTELDLLAELHGTIPVFQKWGEFSSSGGEQDTGEGSSEERQECFRCS